MGAAKSYVSKQGENYNKMLESIIENSGIIHLDVTEWSKIITEWSDTLWSDGKRRAKRLKVILKD